MLLEGGQIGALIWRMPAKIKNPDYSQQERKADLF
jgi:hypothetical protein